MPYTAAIFDLDGLIIDSEPTWHTAHPAFFKKHSIESDPETIKETLGKGLTDVIQLHKEKNGLTGDTAELTAEFRAMFYQEFLSGSEVPVMPGAKEFVKHVAEGGYKIGLATGGHTKEYAVKILERLSLLSYFSVIVSSDMVEKGKPDPEVFLYTAGLLVTDPASCLVFEDSPNGVMAGKRAGMTVIGVNPSEEIQKELHMAEADVVYSTLSDVDIGSL